MDDKYLCQVCMQTLQEPRLLDCLHSFCTNCLISVSTQIVDITGIGKKNSQDDCDAFKQIPASASHTSVFVPDNEESQNELINIVAFQLLKCPICGNETNITKGVYSLPLNLKLQNDIINIKNKMPPCDLCSSSACAFTRCFECDIMMCGLCTDSHMKFRDTAFHKLIQLKTEIAKQTNPKFKQVECSSHKGQDLNFYCWVCAELICYACSSSVHLGHKMDSVPQGAVTITEQIQTALFQAKPIIKQISLDVDLIKYKNNKIKNRCDDVEKEIQLFMQSYLEAVESRWQSLKDEIGEIKRSRLEVLNKNLALLEDKLKKGLTAIELAEDLIQNSTQVEALSIAKPILNRLKLYSEEDLERETKISEFLKFLPDEKVIHSEKYQLFGIISTQSISSENCTLQSDGLLSCRQYKKSSLKLITRDCDNQPLCHGGEQIEAELRYKDASQRVVTVYVQDEGNGSYCLSFTPNISGNMLLTVFVQNRHIKGSPFKVYVSSLRPHKGIFHCCAFCSSGGDKTVACGCKSKMTGGYNGCGHGHEGHPGSRHWSCCGNVLQNSECSQPAPYQCT